MVKNYITLEDYKRHFFSKDYDKYDGFTLFRKNISVRSFKYQLMVIKSNKLKYNRHDDICYILEDTIYITAHGYYYIN